MVRTTLRSRPAISLLRVVGVVLAVACIAAAFPRIIAGLIAWPYDPVPRHDGSIQTLQRLERAEDALKTALAWHDDDHYWGLLAQARYRLANQRDVQRQQEEALLQRAADAQMESLARRPIDTHGWTRLATIRLRLDGPSAAFQTAYRRAVETGSWAPRLLVPRAMLGLLAGDRLPADLEAAAQDQLERAVRYMPQALARATENSSLQRLVLDRLAHLPALRCRAAAAFANRLRNATCGS